MFNFDRAIVNNPTSILPTNAEEFMSSLRKKLVSNGSLRTSIQERKVKCLFWECGNYAQEEQCSYGRPFPNKAWARK